ncbi:MAG: hypothetical protein EA392_01390 [Cryomorphaceae bacterium]|nr:MAG: hypothetical protein EA392_01390 [Cryomorphaceae bacterium]
MDKYDLLLLDIISDHRENGLKMNIGLSQLERTFWKRIESTSNLSINQARIGERITRLYLENLIENKGGYCLTRKGRSFLAEQESEPQRMAG